MFTKIFALQDCDLLHTVSWDKTSMYDHQRIIEIESQLAHLARHIESLDEVIVDQGKSLERFAKLLQRLDSRVTGIESHMESGQKPLAGDPEASPWKDPEM